MPPKGKRAPGNTGQKGPPPPKRSKRGTRSTITVKTVPTMVTTGTSPIREEEWTENHDTTDGTTTPPGLPSIPRINEGTRKGQTGTGLRIVVDECLPPGRTFTIREHAGSKSSTTHDCDSPGVQRTPASISKESIETVTYEKPSNNKEPSDADQLARALAETLRTVRENSVAGGNSRLVNRLTTAKHLPSFSGDPLEWENFKEAFESSSTLGEYNEHEQFTRLFGALKGEAREVVSSMLATGRDATAVMKMLQLHFGDKNVLARKLINEVKELPNLSSGKISLLMFASKIKGAANALQSMQLSGYLRARHLIDMIIKKLPDELVFAYYRDTQESEDESPELILLGDYLYKEAEDAARTGRTYIIEKSTRETSRATIKTTRHAHVAMSDQTRRDSKISFDRNKCILCKRDKNHVPGKCYIFEKAGHYERWRLVKEHSLCFMCLRPGHRHTVCRGAKCSTCGAPHNTLLHSPGKANRPASTEESGANELEKILTASDEIEEDSHVVMAGQTQIMAEKILLKIMPIRVIGREGMASIFALLDEGSTVTLLDKQIAQKIGERGCPSALRILGISGEMNVKTEKINFEIEGIWGRLKITGAMVVENLRLPRQTVSKELTEKISAITGIRDVKSYTNAMPQILIGQDNWEAIISKQYLHVAGSNLAISRCSIGWVAHGAANCGGTLVGGQVNVVDTKEVNTEKHARELSDAEVDRLMREYFKLENVGLNAENENRGMQSRIQRLMEKTTTYNGKYWETGLLWTNDCVPKINGFTTARKRLSLLERRLDRDTTYGDLYYREMDRLIEAGYAKGVEKLKENERQWYLPHFGVRNINKPEKVRIVFDAAAKTDNLSFNDQLDAGPDLLKSLPGIILRFRQFDVAFKGDIRDMFLRIRVRETDQSAQMFLYRGRERTKEPSTYRMTRLIFGAKSSPCSAIYVKNINAERFMVENPVAASNVIENSYMDDFIASAETEEQAIQIIKSVVAINEEADLRMHSWASNKPRIIEQIDNGEVAKNTSLKLGNRAGERVLGLIWDESEDTLKFNVTFDKIERDILSGTCVPSKRQVLKVVMSIFDPLGILAPFTLKSKLLMQAIWRSAIRWDERLQEDEVKLWRDWIASLKTIKNCEIPRRMLRGRREDTRAQLHVFCDASAKAYGAVAYLRTENRMGEINVSIIIAKGRVAPLKGQTIPRLELQAAWVGAKLANYVESELEINITRKHLWSDSMITISWIRAGPRTRQIFVANRLEAIAEMTQVSEWNWVPTEQNPADHLTRIDRDTSQRQSAWFTGPEFLSKPEKEWPREKILSEEEKEHIDELEKRSEATINALSRGNARFTIYTRLLGWAGLLNVGRRVRKIAYKWEGKAYPQMSHIAEKRECEDFWVRTAQSEDFEAELKELKRGKPVSKSSKLRNLNPMLDQDGILRINGRATEMHGDDFNNFPIIIDGKHEVARLILKEKHLKYFHGSHETVINELRQRYHFIAVREKLKSLVSKCVGCGLRRGKPVEPMMSDLPACRVAYKLRPFSHCGVDYFGPMFVKIGRRREKRWGVLFTCLTTRAIHLELAHTLNAGSAIMAVQRLAARRGAPNTIYSDNGTNFRAASKELRDAIMGMEKEKLKDFANTKEINWRFNPPLAPHMGGAWERLIRSVKTALRSVLNEQVTTEETLHTTLLEVEHSVNSRPLTHVSVDPRDREALTPNHFLIGCSSGEVNLGRYDGKDMCARRQWRIAQRLADNFWKRWLHEYLPTLIIRKKWNKPEEPLKLGDMVVLIDYQLPRNNWNKGTIVKVMPGKDTCVRVVEIKTPHGNVVRPAHRVIKLMSNAEVQN